jgi:hypothetical protein
MKITSNQMRSVFILAFTFFVLAAAAVVPTRYRWTGAVSNSWMTQANWQYISGPGSPTAYPGQGGASVGITHVAEFDASSSVNCDLGGSYYPTGGFYVGGIEVNGYTGTITQLPGNRLVISDASGISGAYDDQYKAIFNFGVGGQFIGSSYNYTGTEPYQDVVALMIGVEFEVGGSGMFYAPRGIQFRNHVTINASNFDANGGVCHFYPRSGHTYLGIAVGTVTNPYKINVPGVNFYEMKFHVPVWDFQGSDFNVNNDLILATGDKHLNNCTMHVKERILIFDANNGAYRLPAGGINGCAGNGVIVLDGTIPQQIIKTTADHQGPLPNVVINNPLGVQISGPVAIGQTLTFQVGMMTPMTITDTLVFTPSGSVTGADDGKYFDGRVKKHIYSTTAATFEFPVGKNGEYHPIIISSPTGGNAGPGSTNQNYYTQFTAEYFDTPTPSPLSVSATTYDVHDCQYWTLTRNNKPTSNAQVSLTWNSNTCQAPAYFALSSDLRVAQFDGSVWENRGVNGAVGAYTYGSKIQEASGAPVTQFLTGAPTYFTFCHASPYAPTPLTLTTTWTEPTCNPGTDGTATVNVSGAMGTISYSWSTTPVQTTPTATGLAMGTYTVTVTTSFGQSGTAIVNINTSTYSGVTLPSSTVYCGTSLPILLNLGSPAGGTYSGGAYITNAGTDYYFDPQISGPGTFPITYTDGFGCGYTATENIQVDPGPARPFGWEWANGPDITNVSRANDVAYHAAWDFIYVVGNFSGTVDFGGVTLTSAGGEDVYVACYLAFDGSLNWAQRYGGAGDDYGTGITFTGTTIGIVGHFTGTTNFGSFTAISNGDRDGFLCGLSITGIPTNFRSIGYAADDQVNAIANDGTNYYVVGYNNFTGSGTTISFGGGINITDLYAQAFLAKYSLSGTCQWATNGTTDWQKSNVIDINSNGNITVGGYMTWTPHGYLETYTPAGAFLKFNYFEAYPTGSYDYIGVIGGIGHDASGNIYITGAYSDNSFGASTAKFNTTGLASGSFAPITAGTTLNGIKNEIYNAVYSSDLDLINAVNIGANSGNYPHCDIEVDATGNQYITGTFIGTISNLCYSISSFGYDDIFVMKVDNMGVFQWAQKPDGGYFEYNPSLEMDPSGNLYLCGNIAAGPVTFGAFSVNAGATNAFQAKLTPTGTSVYRLAEESTETGVMPTGEFVVSPNPNNGQFNIICTSDAVKDVYVYDMNGRLVYSNIQTTETNLSIDISSEAKGLYMVHVVNGNNVQTERVSNQ